MRWVDFGTVAASLLFCAAPVARASCLDWSNSYGTGTGAVSTGHDAVVMADGGIVAAGASRTYGSLGAVTDASLVIRRYDAAGGLAWQRAYALGAVNPGPPSIAADSGGALWILASLPGQPPPMLKLKLDSAGNVLMSNSASGLGETAMGIAADGQGGVVTVGPVLSATWGGDGVVRRSGADGTPAWTRWFGGSVQVVAAAQGGALIVAAGTVSQCSYCYEHDWLVRAYTLDGVEAWTDRFTSSGLDAAPTAASVDVAGNALIGGWTDEYVSLREQYGFTASARGAVRTYSPAGAVLSSQSIPLRPFPGVAPLAGGGFVTGGQEWGGSYGSYLIGRDANGREAWRIPTPDFGQWSMLAPRDGGGFFVVGDESGSTLDRFVVRAYHDPRECLDLMAGGPPGAIAPYPNPVAGDSVKLYIPLRAGAETLTVEAFDTALRPVRTWRFTAVAAVAQGVVLEGLRGLRTGVYLLRVSATGAAAASAAGTTRLVIKR